MKIYNNINNPHYLYANNAKTNKNKNNLFKKFENKISFGSKNLPINLAKALILELNKHGKNYEVINLPQGITVAEIENVTKLAKTTTFLLDNKKKIVKYRPDGTTPHLSYLYKNDKLTKLTSFSTEGRKVFTDSFSELGLLQNRILYNEKTNLPKKKIIFHIDGKTPKNEITFYEGTTKEESIKNYTNKGRLNSVQSFNKDGKLKEETFYDKDGKIIKK